MSGYNAVSSYEKAVYKNFNVVERNRVGSVCKESNCKWKKEHDTHTYAERFEKGKEVFSG